MKELLCSQVKVVLGLRISLKLSEMLSHSREILPLRYSTSGCSKHCHGGFSHSKNSWKINIKGAVLKLTVYLMSCNQRQIKTLSFQHSMFIPLLKLQNPWKKISRRTSHQKLNCKNSPIPGMKTNLQHY